MKTVVTLALFIYKPVAEKRGPETCRKQIQKLVDSSSSKEVEIKIVDYKELPSHHVDGMLILTNDDYEAGRGIYAGLLLCNHLMKCAIVVTDVDLFDEDEDEGEISDIDITEEVVMVYIKDLSSWSACAKITTNDEKVEIFEHFPSLCAPPGIKNKNGKDLERTFPYCEDLSYIPAKRREALNIPYQPVEFPSEDGAGNIFELHDQVIKNAESRPVKRRRLFA